MDETQLPAQDRTTTDLDKFGSISYHVRSTAVQNFWYLGTVLHKFVHLHSHIRLNFNVSSDYSALNVVIQSMQWNPDLYLGLLGEGGMELF